MPKIKWRTKEDIEIKQAEQEQLKADKQKFRGKDKSKLSRKELDDLIIIMAEEKGLL